METQIIWKKAWTKKNSSLLKNILIKLSYNMKELSSQTLDPQNSTIDGIRDIKLSYISSAGFDWSSILLPLNSLIGDDLSREISKQYEAITFQFMDFDQDAWGYRLWQNGEELDYFWNIPEIVEEDELICKGNPELLASLLELKKEVLSPYLQHLTEKELDSDEFLLNNTWVRTDFMKHLGIDYPDVNKSNELNRWVYIYQKE